MTPEQRDKLLDLHRAAMTAHEYDGSGVATDMADDEFRDYLFSLPVEPVY